MTERLPSPRRPNARQRDSTYQTGQRCSDKRDHLSACWTGVMVKVGVGVGIDVAVGVAVGVEVGVGTGVGVRVGVAVDGL